MKQKQFKEILEWVKSIGVALILAWIITSFVKPTLVHQTSMYPTLNNNDYLLLYRKAYVGEKKPAPGEIIVFRSELTQENGEKKNLIKRVIATEGDRIRIEDGKVYVNEHEIEEDYIQGNFTAGTVDQIVPKGEVFVMGDNRPLGKSIDSRDSSIGTVKEESILGRVFIRLYPFNRIQIF